MPLERECPGRAWSGDLEIQIIGVVKDAKYAEVKAEVPPLFFTPYRQYREIGAMTFYLKTGDGSFTPSWVRFARWWRTWIRIFRWRI